MRISLNLDYVLRRTCDSGRPWVAWCPQFGACKQGAGPTEALFLTRQACRVMVETWIGLGDTPHRYLSKTASLDEDWPAYQEYLNRFADDPGSDDDWNPPDRWTHVFGSKYLPDYIDTAFVHCAMEIETFGQECLVSDQWYNEIWYKNSGRVEVTALVEQTFHIDSAIDDHEEWIRRHYGSTVVHKILRVKTDG